MAPILVATGFFGCIFGGALAGIWLQSVLPKHHLNSETRELVKLGLGLIGTMSALVLGLLVASTKASYDTHRSEFTQIAASTILLDRILMHYGPEAESARAALRAAVSDVLKGDTAIDRSEMRGLNSRVVQEAPFDAIQELTPHSDRERTLQSQAESLVINIGQTRWLLFAQSGTSISAPFLIVVVVWLTVLSLSFGMFAPRNGTAIAALLISALSVAGAIFLILELDQPFTGLMRISDAPLRNALALLGK
jgi:hypothetical protein